MDNLKKNNQSSRLIIARESLIAQSNALISMANSLGNEFAGAIDLILATQGRVVICGMGKSGLVGKKMTATFASTGTPSFFMHPAEAFHGDLGMLTRDDLLILISYSGETEELLNLLPSLQHFGNQIISMVGNIESTLAKYANVILNVKVEREVCPNNLAPTTSTLATMGMGDALAVALIKERNFQAEDFARYHPGGSLGKRLLSKVSDLMHIKNLPIVDLNTYLSQAILAISEGRLGLVVIIDNKQIKGIITDGDLRRALVAQIDMNEVTVNDVMTPNPICIQSTLMLIDAESLMLSHKIKALIVTNQEQQMIGILNIFDR
jgi:arabinose-5-phosphate isomerase